MEKRSPVTREWLERFTQAACIIGMDEVSRAAASRLMPGLSVSATSRPRKSIKRLLKKVGSPSGVRRQMWTRDHVDELLSCRSALRFGAM